MYTISPHPIYSEPTLLLKRWLTFLMMCALISGCNRIPADERERQELALFNDVLDQVAWQTDEGCSHPTGMRAILSSKQHGDSVKTMLRAKPQRSVLYYQAKIAAPHKGAKLSDWIAVEINAWERFFRTFDAPVALEAAPALAVTSSLDAGKLHVDYFDIAKLDTAVSATDSMKVIRFSKPFYHEERNRAIVYFESVCSSTRATAEMLMLRRKDNRWVIEERRSVWNRQ